MYILNKHIKEQRMKKKNFSLYWIVLALIILGLCGCRTTQGANSDSRDAPDFHTTRISLSWDGYYTGTVLSDRGRTISTLLILKGNDTFELGYSYDDIPDSFIAARGKFKWDKTESNITLKVKDFPPYYRVVSNKLIQLDRNGEAIKGNLSENYALGKK
jgi:hypothetical protein